MSYYTKFAQPRRLILPTQKYIAAMATKPAFDVARAYDDVLIGLRRYNISNQDAAWFLSSHDAAAARINALDPSNDTLQVTGSPTFTQYRHYAGVSNTGYLDAQRNLNALPNYAQNNMHLTVWDAGTVVNQNSFCVGNPGASTGLVIRPSYNGSPGNFTASIQSAASSSLSLGNGGAGMKSIERDGATSDRMYKNGVSIATPGTTSSAPAATPLRILTNINGFTNTTGVRFVMIGGFIGQTKMANLYTDILLPFMNFMDTK